MNSIHTLKSYLTEIHFSIIFPSPPRSFEWSVSFRLSSKYLVLISHAPHVGHTPRPSHSPWRDHPNSVWWRVQITKLLTVRFPPASCHFVQHRCKWSPEHPVVRHPQPVFFPQCDRQCFTPMQKVDKIILLYILLFTFLDEKREDKLHDSKHFLNLVCP
jgi:hypothetical protein